MTASHLGSSVSTLCWTMRSPCAAASESHFRPSAMCNAACVSPWADIIWNRRSRSMPVRGAGCVSEDTPTTQRIVPPPYPAAAARRTHCGHRHGAQCGAQRVACVLRNRTAAATDTNTDAQSNPHTVRLSQQFPQRPPKIPRAPAGTICWVISFQVRHRPPSTPEPTQGGA